jgi:uncharacterized protein (DUF1499 family)
MNASLGFIIVFVLVFSGCSGTKPDLGINNGDLIPCPETPNCVNSQTIDEKHYIQPLDYKGTQQEAQYKLLQILESEKRTKIIVTQRHYIRAEFRSALFRFVDDVEFYFPKETRNEKIIHVRSASRVGHSDLGVNRRRIERIRKKFRQ